MKNLQYSEELNEVLNKEPGGLVRYGIGIIFLSCLILIFYSRTIEFPETFNGSIEFAGKAQASTPSQSAGPGQMSVRLYLSPSAIQKLQSNQTIIFRQLNVKGIIQSLQDTIYKDGQLYVNLVLKPVNQKSRAILNKQTGKTAVNIVQKKMSLFDKLFNYTIKPLT